MKTKSWSQRNTESYDQNRPKVVMFACCQQASFPFVLPWPEVGVWFPKKLDRAVRGLVFLRQWFDSKTKCSMLIVTYINCDGMDTPIYGISVTAWSALDLQLSLLNICPNRTGDCLGRSQQSPEQRGRKFKMVLRFDIRLLRAWQSYWMIDQFGYGELYSKV